MSEKICPAGKVPCVHMYYGTCDVLRMACGVQVPLDKLEAGCPWPSKIQPSTEDPLEKCANELSNEMVNAMRLDGKTICVSDILKKYWPKPSVDIGALAIEIVNRVYSPDGYRMDELKEILKKHFVHQSNPKGDVVLAFEGFQEIEASKYYEMNPFRLLSPFEKYKQSLREGGFQV